MLLLRRRQALNSNAIATETTGKNSNVIATETTGKNSNAIATEMTEKNCNAIATGRESENGNVFLTGNIDGNSNVIPMGRHIIITLLFLREGRVRICSNVIATNELYFLFIHLYHFFWFTAKLFSWLPVILIRFIHFYIHTYKCMTYYIYIHYIYV